MFVRADEGPTPKRSTGNDVRRPLLTTKVAGESQIRGVCNRYPVLSLQPPNVISSVGRELLKVFAHNKPIEVTSFTHDSCRPLKCEFGLLPFRKKRELALEQPCGIPGGMGASESD